MQLVITEKPSVAKSIAEVLHATEHKNGYLQGNGYLVSWCVGHLVELSQPEAYDEKYAIELAERIKGYEKILQEMYIQKILRRSMYINMEHISSIQTIKKYGITLQSLQSLIDSQTHQ